ncbi:MAG TPA: hypothetical protein GXX35_04555 [Thermoanaerobacterales bacterium]|nr:hypothetical protein [Thermoanaerobacterales bacterium]
MAQLMGIFGILPYGLNKEFNLFDYALTINNFDSTRLWMGFICLSIFISLISGFFIGVNLMLSSYVYMTNRLNRNIIFNLASFQNYFGVAVYSLYGLSFIIITLYCTHFYVPKKAIKFLGTLLIIFSIIIITSGCNYSKKPLTVEIPPADQKYIYYNFENSLLIPVPAKSKNVQSFKDEWLDSMDIKNKPYMSFLKRDYIKSLTIKDGIVYLDFTKGIIDYGHSINNPHFIAYAMDAVVKNFTQFEGIKSIRPTVEGEKNIEIASEGLAEEYGKGPLDRLVNMAILFSDIKGKNVMIYAIQKDLQEPILIPYTIPIPEKIIIDGKILEIDFINKIIEKTINIQFKPDEYFSNVISLFKKIYDDQEYTYKIEDNILKIFLPEKRYSSELKLLVKSIAIYASQFNLNFEIFVGENKVNVISDS